MIDPVQSTANHSLPGVNAPSSAAADPLGRNAFLNLLVTQMQHQDPLAPQADGAFLAQLAQFSSLEQLTGIQEQLAQLRILLEDATTPPDSPATNGGV